MNMLPGQPSCTSSTQTLQANRPTKKRRHTRIHLDALRPSLSTLTMKSLSECPKCQGLLYVDGGETLNETIIRCLNCGWQPQHQLRMIHETEDAQDMRALTARFASNSEGHRLSVGF